MTAHGTESEMRALREGKLALLESIKRIINLDWLVGEHFFKEVLLKM